MMMIFGAIGGINLAGETEVLGGNLLRGHFVHHKIPHDDPVFRQTVAVYCEKHTDTHKCTM
jgi:hypothetical protein